MSVAPNPVVIADNVVWHTEHPDDPTVALCGEHAGDGDPHVPGEEVPDAQVCAECLRLERLGV